MASHSRAERRTEGRYQFEIRSVNVSTVRRRAVRGRFHRENCFTVLRRLRSTGSVLWCSVRLGHHRLCCAIPSKTRRMRHGGNDEATRESSTRRGGSRTRHVKSSFDYAANRSDAMQTMHARLATTREPPASARVRALRMVTRRDLLATPWPGTSSCAEPCEVKARCAFRSLARSLAETRNSWRSPSSDRLEDLRRFSSSRERRLHERAAIKRTARRFHMRDTEEWSHLSRR